MTFVFENGSPVADELVVLDLLFPHSHSGAQIRLHAYPDTPSYVEKTTFTQRGHPNPSSFYWVTPEVVVLLALKGWIQRVPRWGSTEPFTWMLTKEGTRESRSVHELRYAPGWKWGETLRADRWFQYGRRLRGGKAWVD